MYDCINMFQDIQPREFQNIKIIKEIFKKIIWVKS